MQEPDKHILVVDDDPQLTALITNTLELEGCWVTCCASGEEALDVLRKRSFDLIVTDIKMPGLSGLDLLRYVRAESPHCPVIVMTAYPSLASAKEALRGQAVDYLEKPFTLLELRQAIKRALRARATEGGDNQFCYEELTINYSTRTVYVRRDAVSLARREYTFLVFLAERQGRPAVYEELLRAVWKTEVVNEHTKSWVKTCAHRLRRKLGDHGRRPHLILTLRNVGYQLGRSTTAPEPETPHVRPLRRAG